MARSTAPTPSGKYMRNLNSTHASESFLLSRRAFLGSLCVGSTVLTSWWPAHSYTQAQQTFLEGWRALDKAYVDKSFNGQNWLRLREEFLKKRRMESEREAHEALQELTQTLKDPFTRFLKASEYDVILEQQARGSERAGIGVELTLNEDGYVVVVSAIPEGPAEAAGLSSGDILISVNGDPLYGMSLYEAADLLQGPPGTKVSIRFKGKNSDEPKEQTIERKKLRSEVPIVSTICKAVSGQRIGFLRLSRFTDGSAAEAKRAIQSLKEEGATSFIIDLRKNPGGSFGESVDFVKAFLPGGTVVNIADSQGVRDIYDAEGSIPLVSPSDQVVVLVDKGTASAAEVFVGALKDNQRATVLGETTFGKGLIQSLIELSDGSALAVSVAKYQTPSGIDINAVGIEPNVSSESIEDLPIDTTFCSVVKGSTQGAVDLQRAAGLV